MTDPVVVVPLDGSRNALRALPVARLLADLEKAPVRIVHVAGEVGPLGKTAESLGLAPADLRGCAFEVRAGRPGEAILAVAAERGARLIVMCAYSADIQPAIALGPTTRAVLSGARCPVALVKPGPAPDGWALRRMLALHDGSPGASRAMGPAIELARKAGAELILLQIAGDERALEAGSIAPPVYLDQFQHTWPAWSGEFLQRLASVCSLTDVRVRLSMGHGELAAETIRVADEESADLIVVAGKGSREAPDDLTLAAVLDAARCPILVTRVPPG